MIAIGSDHAGYDLKVRVIEYLDGHGLALTDHGTFSNERADYPKFAHAVANHVGKDKNVWGILICGSANGVAITANKHPEIRCAVCWSSEIAQLARAHNNANILALPARFISEKEAFDMIDIFRSTAFEGGRHQLRVDQITCS